MKNLIRRILKACVAAYSTLKESELSDIEQEVISTAVSTVNECTYCVPVHSTVADMINMPESTLA